MDRQRRRQRKHGVDDHAQDIRLDNSQVPTEISVRDGEQAVAGHHQGQRRHEHGKARAAEQQLRPETFEGQQHDALETDRDAQQSQRRRQVRPLLGSPARSVGDEPGDGHVEADRADGKQEGQRAAGERVLAESARTEHVGDEAEDGQVAEDEECFRREGRDVVAVTSQPLGRGGRH